MGNKRQRKRKAGLGFEKDELLKQAEQVPPATEEQEEAGGDPGAAAKAPAKDGAPDESAPGAAAEAPPKDAPAAEAAAAGDAGEGSAATKAGAAAPLPDGAECSASSSSGDEAPAKGDPYASEEPMDSPKLAAAVPGDGGGTGCSGAEDAAERSAELEESERAAPDWGADAEPEELGVLERSPAPASPPQAEAEPSEAAISPGAARAEMRAETEASIDVAAQKTAAQSNGSGASPLPQKAQEA